MSQVKEELLSKKLLRQAKRNEYTRVEDLVVGHNKLSRGPLTLHLADIWGFCYGVLYAIEEVGEVLENHPEKDVWILGDLIHNPHVNQELQTRGATFIDLDELERIKDGDVVVIPAFGTKKEIFDYLDERDVITVDTTCPEVEAVEHEVLAFNQENHTAVIHGKHEHQESIATSSFADRYLIIRDLEEAQYVCDYIENGGSAAEFLDRFNQACSGDFDPDRDLQQIGLANQTTMLMNESLKIFEMIEQAVENRDGDKQNVKTIDTICSATQDRQDAVQKLTRSNQFDLFLVVGGHTSSNTKNLARTVSQRASIPVYHIQDAGSFDRERITFLPLDSRTAETSRNWLPEGECSVGVTAGASTPHSELESVLRKMLSFYDSNDGSVNE